MRRIAPRIEALGPASFVLLIGLVAGGIQGIPSLLLAPAATQSTTTGQARHPPSPPSLPMPQRFAALLRGINLGGAKRVPMTDLRSAIAALGFTDVRTLLNSGNVVFTGRGRAASSLAQSIEAAVEASTGVRARVTVVPSEDFTDILQANPLQAHATDPSRALVAFLRDPRQARGALAGLAERSWAPELLAVGAAAAYLWCPLGIAGGRLAKAVDKALGDQVTMRNWATVTRLHALLTASCPSTPIRATK